MLKLNIEDSDFKEQFDFAIWSIGGSSDYRNDRERPYDGQPHTNFGNRGKREVKNITMRDISDCIVQGFLATSGIEELQNKTKELNNELKGTKYENKNNWRYQDIYKIKCDFDPLAVIQNTICYIEDMMGVYPNISKLERENIIKEIFEEEI